MSQKKVLVIDDESDVQDIVRACLKTRNHRVFTASGGEEGLAIAERERPDLIVLDLMMPKMSGMEVIKRLRAHSRLRTIPVIVISALAAENAQTLDAWIRGLGVEDFVQKPFDPLDLLGRVEYLFRRHNYVSAQRPAADDETADSSARTDTPQTEDSSLAESIDLEVATPTEVVVAFVGAWNTSSFGTEYDCLAEEMQAGLKREEYIDRRVSARETERARTQRVLTVQNETISVGLAKVIIDREESVSASRRVWAESYALKRTHLGWKIISVRPVKKASPAAP